MKGKLRFHKTTSSVQRRLFVRQDLFECKSWRMGGASGCAFRMTWVASLQITHGYDYLQVRRMHDGWPMGGHGFLHAANSLSMIVYRLWVRISFFALDSIVSIEEQCWACKRMSQKRFGFAKYICVRKARTFLCYHVHFIVKPPRW